MTIGNTTGTLNFTSNVTFGTPTTILGNTIDLAAGVALSSGVNNLTLTADHSITLNPGSSITSTSGNIVLEANQQAIPTVGNFIGIYLAGATIQSNSGSIALTAQGGNTGSSNHGVNLSAASQILTTDGAITLTGSGGAGNDQNYGIFLIDSNTRISSSTGAILLQGTGGTGVGNFNEGIRLQNGSQIISTGIGSVS